MPELPDVEVYVEAMSRLLHGDWPRTIEELERHPALGPARAGAAPDRGASR